MLVSKIIEWICYEQLRKTESYECIIYLCVCECVHLGGRWYVHIGGHQFHFAWNDIWKALDVHIKSKISSRWQLPQFKRECLHLGRCKGRYQQESFYNYLPSAKRIYVEYLQPLFKQFRLLLEKSDSKNIKFDNSLLKYEITIGSLI